MQLFNTLTKKKEEFIPLKTGHISFYQCGPTVYWTQHIGNLRAAVLADFMRRTMDYAGFQVHFVRNYTDVGHLVSDGDTGEDKMTKGVKREGLSPKEIADKYIKIFEQDTTELNILEPDQKPRVTEYISQIIDLVKLLLEKGYAYTTDLAIYFDTTKAKDYTRLSGQNLAENREGAGSAEICDIQKKNSADFSIWLFRAGDQKNALQYWPSPFTSPLVENGEGFPGWHIECSAMIKSLLGNTIDIHMGGIEHIPVHHTNEIAQSESANDSPLAHYWLHNEWLTVNDGKMAKSQGTGFSLSEVKEKGFTPLALRYFYLQAHYRSKQNFTWEALKAAETGFKRLQNNIAKLGDKKGKLNLANKQKFLDCLLDDFNTSSGLAVVQELLKSDLNDSDKLATIIDFDKVLGLNLATITNDQITNQPIIPEAVKKLLAERQIARQNKNWQKADELRNEISHLGYEINDSDSSQEISLK